MSEHQLGATATAAPLPGNADAGAGVDAGAGETVNVSFVPTSMTLTPPTDDASIGNVNADMSTPYVDPNVIPNVNVNVNPNVNPNVDPNVNPNVNLNVAPSAGQNVNPNVNVNVSPNVSLAHPDPHIEDLTTRFVNAMLPPGGVGVPIATVPAGVSTAPPVVSTVAPNVLQAQQPSGIVSAAPSYGYATVGYPVVTSVPLFTQAQAPYSSAGLIGAPSYGGHPLAPTLWNWHQLAQPHHVTNQFAPPSQLGPYFPAQYRMVSTPPVVSTPPAVSQGVSFVGPTPTPVVPVQAGPPIVQAPPVSSVALGANTAPSYVYGAPQSQASYWGSSQPQSSVSSSLFRPELPPPGASNVIHPSISSSSRHRPEYGLEYLDQRTIDSAINGECVALEDFLQQSECDELKSNIDTMGNLQVKSVRVRKNINSVLKWLEAWAPYEMVLCKRYGYNVYYEMARYRMFIIGISQKFRFQSVAAYDLRHRQRLANAGSFLFSSVDHELYVTTFDIGAIKSTNRCGKCGSSDHGTSECSRSAGAAKGNPDKSKGQNRGKKTGKGDEICYNFQSGSCSWGANCFRRHKCVGCGGDNPQSSCNSTSCKAAVARAASAPAGS